MNLTSNAASLLSTIYEITNLNTRLTSDLQVFNQIVTSNVALMNTNLTSNVVLMNTNLTSNVALMNTVMGNTPPPFTIVAIYSKQIPIGWQLCDGNPFMAMDNQPVYIRQNNGNIQANTPNLLGHTIIGATPDEWSASAIANITKREMGSSGGTETHTLTINEMPAHQHEMLSSQNNVSGGGASIRTIGGGGTGYGPYGNTTSAGSGAPHNNMQPFVAIPYIIKRPLLGGSTRAHSIFEYNPNYLMG